MTTLILRYKEKSEKLLAYRLLYVLTLTGQEDLLK